MSSQLDKTKQSLAQYQKTIAESNLFSTITKSLFPASDDITTIRCLALGSPIESINARYQLALLVELAKHVSVSHISLYDPVFTPEDIDLFKDIFENVDTLEEFKTNSTTTLYFLPHAPLDLTETIFKTYKPMFVLANDIVSHTDRLTKAKLLETYPVLATMVHIANKSEQVDDGFKVVKKKKNRHALKEVQVVYDLDMVYFDDVQVEKYPADKGDPWGNSFSDLSFIRMVPKSTTKEQVVEK